MTDWYVGQKVVCVDDDWGCCNPNFPQKGSIYVIEKITSYFDTLLYFNLKDVKTFKFRSDCFRPIVDQETDISVFTDILKGVSKDTREPIDAEIVDAE